MSASLDAYIRRVVDSAPPLTDEQAAQIVAVFGKRSRLEPMPRTFVRPAPRRCSVYRYFDSEGNLLYVGLTVNSENRRRDHARGSNFYEFQTRLETEWFDTEDEARAAERNAIKTERPLFNRVGAGADRDARLLDYLLARNALHLVRPA